MNLHGIAAGAIGSVNPFIAATVQKSTGYATQPSGNRVAAYAAPLAVKIQKQALTAKDIAQIDGMNIQGLTAALYVQGSAYGVDRVQGQGGDLFTFTDKSLGERLWLVVMVAEIWPDWCKVIVNLQLDE